MHTVAISIKIGVDLYISCEEVDEAGVTRDEKKTHHIDGGDPVMMCGVEMFRLYSCDGIQMKHLLFEFIL